MWKLLGVYMGISLNARGGRQGGLAFASSLESRKTRVAWGGGHPGITTAQPGTSQDRV